MSRLLGCPFCGEEPKKDYATLSEVWTIHCNHEDCDVGCEVSDRNEHAVIEVWNTRAAISTLPVAEAYTQEEMDEADREAAALHTALFASPVAEAGVREALEPFAKLAEFTSEKHRDNRPIIYGLDEPVLERITVGDLRRAKAALAALTSPSNGEVE